MKKQYLPEYQHRYKPGEWSNAAPGYFNQVGKRYCETLEEAVAALRKVTEYFNGSSRVDAHSCGSFTVTSATDSKTAKALAVVKTRIRVREVTEWETVDLENMRDAAAIPSLSKAIQDDGTVCYFFGGTTIRAEESVDHGEIRLKPVAGDQVACGEWTDLDIDQVAGYCVLLERHLNREGETA